MPHSRKRTTNVQMIVTSDAKLCARVNTDDLRCSKTLLVRAAQRCRPVQLCSRPVDCTDDTCTLVHAKSADIFESWRLVPVHANLVYNNATEIKYPTSTAAGVVHVLCPNSVQLLDTDVPMQHVLATKATVSMHAGDTMVHCAHFYFEQACNRGSHCQFAHVVTIKSYTPVPGHLQWAPKKVIERPRPAAPDRRESTGEDGALTPLFGGTPSLRTSGRTQRSHSNASSTTPSVGSSPSSASSGGLEHSTSTSSGAFRHNPYSPDYQKTYV